MRYVGLFWLVLTLVLSSCASKSVSTKQNTQRALNSKGTHKVPFMALNLPSGAVFTLDEKATDRFSDSCQALSFREGVLYYNIDRDPLDTIDAITHIERNYKKKCLKR